MVNEINKILDGSANKCGMIREKFTESKVPFDFQKIHIIVYFGEFDHLFVFNNLILPHLRNKTQYKDKYIIFVTWNGFANLIENVDEVWSLKNHDVNERLYEKSNGFKNYSDAFTIINRNLNEHFRNVVKAEKFEDMFCHGFNFQFYKNDKLILVKKHECANVNYLSRGVLDEINKLDTSSRYFIIPFKFIRLILNGKSCYYKITSNFWQTIINRMIQKQNSVVLLKNSFTYDLSSYFVENKNVCFVQENNWYNVIGYMKQTNMFVDFFGGLSCFAQHGECPNISIVERSYYNQMNLEQIEDLISCNKNINKKHYSFFQFFADDVEQNYLYTDQLLRILKKNEIKSSDIYLNYSINLDDYLKSKVKKYNLKFIGYKKINERVV